MRKFLKSAGLPIGVFALAIGSAFATNAMKNVNPDRVIGYQQLDSEELTCVKKIECAVLGSQVCTWNDPVTNLDHNLYGMEAESNETSCTRPLFRIE
ncbi:DUF6520 family protein [Myroides phaeus]|uniref:DUF6520 family protein n=1 Tax=Myroides phaeus TaxID=702745 RepID=UPI0013030A97|nr:DUF6520 family protein [Myroides phaeus]